MLAKPRGPDADDSRVETRVAAAARPRYLDGAVNGIGSDDAGKDAGPKADGDGGDVFRRLMRKQKKKDDDPDRERAMMAHKWRSFPQGVDALVRLDVDLFEDVFDSLAVMIRDDEASEALEALPKNAVGGYALDDVVRWWRARQAKKAAAGSPAREAGAEVAAFFLYRGGLTTIQNQNTIFRV